jgi:hypothetical protein
MLEVIDEILRDAEVAARGAAALGDFAVVFSSRFPAVVADLTTLLVRLHASRTTVE